MGKTIATLALLVLGTVYGARAVSTCSALHSERTSTIDARVARSMR